MYRNSGGTRFQAGSKLVSRPLTETLQQRRRKHAIKTDKEVSTIATSSFVDAVQQTDQPTGFLRENKVRRGCNRAARGRWKA